MSDLQTMHGIDTVIDDPDDDTEEVVNISQYPAKLNIDGTRMVIPPNGRVRIHKNYVRGAKHAGRDPVASPISLMTNNRVVPATDKRVPRAQMPKSTELIQE